MTTRRELITNLYNNFLEEARTTIDNQEIFKMFPSLETTNLGEILTFFNMTFGYIDEYEPAIRDLIYLYGIKISDEEIERELPIITKFINELKELQK